MDQATYQELLEVISDLQREVEGLKEKVAYCVPDVRDSKKSELIKRIEQSEDFMMQTYEKVSEIDKKIKGERPQ